MQEGQTITIAVVSTLFIISNTIFVAYYAGEYDFIYVNILKSRYVKSLNIGILCGIKPIVLGVVLFQFCVLKRQKCCNTRKYRTYAKYILAQQVVNDVIKYQFC